MGSPKVKETRAIKFTAGGHEIEIPVLIARGAKPGKTLVVSAGVHGDEFEGVRAIFDTFRHIDTTAMSGNLIAVPVANPPAFWNCTRTSPLDGRNLARVFPGNANGSPTEAIAFYFDRDILPQADLYLDLHSAGVKCAMPTLVGYHEPDTAARDAALVFGAPYVWCHPTVAAGRTVSAAIARGIPALYAEARGAGRINPGDLLCYRRGIDNLMRHLEILPGEPEIPDAPRHLYGDGNIDSSVSSSQRGFLIPSVELMEPVAKGQPLGVLVDVFGNELEKFVAPREGVVVLIHACPLVNADEPLFMVTGAAQ
jgi:predicted deacylase